MKKYSTFEGAIAQYTEYIGCIPEAGHMFNIYHRYRNEWKAYKSFLDWLIYHEEVI